jgi:electron transport complex protein RnfC
MRWPRSIDSASPSCKAPLYRGDLLRLDTKSGVVLEKLPKAEVEDLVLEECPTSPTRISGGLAAQIDQIRDAIELPVLYAEHFAAHKLSPPKGKPIDTIIINGAECEPYLTADYRLMIEKPVEIIEGLKILMKCLGVHKGFVGIEDNKPDAIRIMKNAVQKEPAIEVCELEVKYPQGAEKMLIKATTGREVPPRGLAQTLTQG